MSLTIKDIAKLSGVSRGTVDRAIHNRGRVAPDVKERILNIVKECNYHPNVIAQQLSLKSQKHVIGFISKYDFGGFWSIVNSSAKSQAQRLFEYGITIESRFFNYCKPELQLKLINELLDIKINALVIVPLESETITKKLKEVSSSGIPVILLNSETDGFDPLCYIGSDYYVAGKTAAGLLSSFNKSEKLKVLILSGSEYLTSHKLRKNGFIDELSALRPDSEIVISSDITNDPEYAYHTAKKILIDNSAINAVYTIPDNAAAVGNAIKDIGKLGSITHIGFSMTDSTRPNILDGSISALIGHRAEAQGRLPFEILYDYFATNKKPDSKRYLMLNDIFIKQNSVF